MWLAKTRSVLSVACILTLLLSSRNAHAISAYVLDPKFRQEVVPLITDTSRFADFMDKYKDKKYFTDKDRADILYSLGIASFAPQWLTMKARKIVNIYHPDAFKRHANIVIKYAMIANTSITINDANPLDLADADVMGGPLLSFPSMQAFSIAIGDIFAAVPALPLALSFGTGFTAGSMLTQAAINAVQSNSANQTSEQKSNADRVNNRGQISNCNEHDENFLNNRADYVCKAAEKCTEADIGKLDIISAKIDAHRACMVIRQDIIDQCYGGKGDDGHRKYIFDRENAIRKCEYWKKRIMKTN